MQPITTLLSTENAATGKTLSKNALPMEASIEGNGDEGFFDILLEPGTPRTDGDLETSKKDMLISPEVAPAASDERPSTGNVPAKKEHLLHTIPIDLATGSLDRDLPVPPVPETAGRGEWPIPVRETQEANLPTSSPVDGEDAVEAGVVADLREATRSDVPIQTKQTLPRPADSEAGARKGGSAEAVQQERAPLALTSKDRPDIDSPLPVLGRDGSSTPLDRSGEFRSAGSDDGLSGADEKPRLNAQPSSVQSAGVAEKPVSTADPNERSTKRSAAVLSEGVPNQPGHEGHSKVAERAAQTRGSENTPPIQAAAVRTGRPERYDRYEGAPEAPASRTVATSHTELRGAPMVATQSPGPVLANPSLVSDAAVIPEEPTSIEAVAADLEDGIKKIVADRARPEPAAARSIVSQVVHAITRPQADGTVEIRLQPEELGRVRMSMSPGEVGVTVQITAERPETLDLLRRNIDMLEAELADRGFSEMSFSFGAETSEEDTTKREETPSTGDAMPEEARVTQVDIVTGEPTSLNGKLDIRV